MTNNKECDPGLDLVRHLTSHAACLRLLELEFARDQRLRLSDLRCLQEFVRDRELPIRCLVRRLGLSSSRISRILDRLEDRHYVKREIDPLDRRSINVHTTAKGDRITASFTAFLLPFYLPPLERLKPREIELTSCVLGEILQTLRIRAGQNRGAPETETIKART